MGRLDLEASFRGAACLVEWPERLAAGHAPPQRLELWIEIIGEVRLSHVVPQAQGVLPGLLRGAAAVMLWCCGHA